MIGRIIGNYEITSELARGGMGTVYRGRHLHLPREIVIKSILLTAYTLSAQQHLKARFRREAYIQSQLDHPNIVRVYEFFALDDNYYLVMEYVPGMSLKDLIAQPGLPPTAQATHLCKQALAALNYAHNFNYVDESNTRNRGVIHRDIKPANLLLDDRGRLKITDFGIVKVTGDEALTASGFQPGTVEYMSPEQLLGLNIDERSDIYSLGVTFYEMITGRLPFPRSMTGSDWDVRKGHVELEPPSVLEMRPDLHPALAAIIMRTLRKNSHERFQSASEFLDALHEYEKSAQSGGYYQPIPTGHLPRSVFAGPTIIDQTLILPEPTAPFETTSALPSSTQHPLEESLTIPIAPARAVSKIAPTRSAVRPARRELDSNPANRKVFISVPAGPPRSRWPLAAALAGALILLAAASAYFFSGQKDPAKTLSSAATRIEVALPSPTTRPSAQIDVKSKAALPAPDNSALNRARAFEEQERYPEAIREYEEHLRRNPTAANARLVSDKLITLKQFQGLIAAASVAMENKKFVVARQNYIEALKLLPESQLAKAGLAETKAGIKRIKFGRAFHRQEGRQDGPPRSWQKMRRTPPTP